ncbi:MAG: N-acetylmuramic acid 6-phosphate etherase [Flavobacteriales bacterium]
MSTDPTTDHSPLPPTEQSGAHGALESASVADLIGWMHKTDGDVHQAVGAALPALEKFIEALVPRMAAGGRLFYIGAGTSGRLGIVDASECPPTFGVHPDRVVGLIAGGDGAIREAVEGAEDDPAGAWRTLQTLGIQDSDSLLGIAASGRTPYVIGGLSSARQHGLLTGAIVCNPDSAVAAAAEHPIEAITGPEFVTGSTRLKAGTATKLLLNMISTVTMIQLGHVQGNRMVDMKPANAKLMERGSRMIAEELGVGLEKAGELLEQHASVREALKHARSKKKRGDHA